VTVGNATVAGRSAVEPPAAIAFATCVRIPVELVEVSHEYTVAPGHAVLTTSRWPAMRLSVFPPSEYVPLAATP
jgi:hypothetical protein